MNGTFPQKSTGKLRFNRTYVRISGIFYGFGVGPPSLRCCSRLRLRPAPPPRRASVPAAAGPASVCPWLRQWAPNRSARCMAQRRVSACKARRLALSLAPRPAVLPPAAPRAPWPSPLPGAALSRNSVNSMRGWLFGGWPPLRALRVPGSLPALPPGSLRSSGVVRRAGRPAAVKNQGGQGPQSGSAQYLGPGPIMVPDARPCQGGYAPARPAPPLTGNIRRKKFSQVQKPRAQPIFWALIVPFRP